MMGDAYLLRGDATNLPMADGSVDAVITSPPYFALRSYQDEGDHFDGQIGSEPTPGEFLEALWAATREMARVLKPTGSIWVNLGDKYAGGGGHNNSNAGERATRRGPASYNKASDVRDKSLMGLPWLYALGCTGALAAMGGPDPGLNLILRAEVIWSKPNGLPDPATDRVRRSHEQWFHFTTEPKYYTAIDELRTPVKTSGGLTWEERKALGDAARYCPDNGHASAGMAAHELGRLPGSVWEVSLEGLRVPDWINVDHYAAFPQEWPRRIIIGWTPPGICSDCGEGRRPRIEVSEAYKAHRAKWGDWNADNRVSEGYDLVQGHRASSPPPPPAERQIVGHSCGCGDDSTAPTRPAVVLDPFSGTGTVAMVARALGRVGVGLDLSGDYLRLAQWRVFESGHARKTRERTDRERQGVLL